MKIAISLLGLLMAVQGAQTHKPVVTQSNDGCNTTTYIDGVATTTTTMYCPKGDSYPLVPPPITVTNSFRVYGEAGRVLLYCGEGGEWGADDFKLSDCKISSGSSLEEVLTVIIREMRRLQKLDDDERKRTLKVLDDVLNFLDKKPTPRIKPLTPTPHSR